jgi:hypothetical protein
VFEGVWADLVLALTGGGVMTLGILGLALGGNLPKVRIPERVRPAAKFAFTLAILVGLTLLLDKGSPDLLDRVWTQLTA